MLWVFLTVAAAAAQTFRNALQRSLTDTVGPLGAAHARFLYGLPFAVLFVAILWAAGHPPPMPTQQTLLWGTVGGVAQIGATVCLLSAMKSSSFLVAVAYTKTEPALVLLIAWSLVGEFPTPVQAIAVLAATMGVVLMAWPARETRQSAWGVPLALGVGAGALFALSAVCFREAILSLDHENYMTAAITMLAFVLFVQTVLLSAWIGVTQPRTLVALLARPSTALPPGFCGAVASAFWFMAFALAPTSLVRTLALVEVGFSHVLGRRFFAERVAPREAAGALILTLGIAGVLLGA